MTLDEARILVVDDEVPLARMYARWLIASGCPKVGTVHDGRAALEIILASEVNVLVCDVRMPMMDGLELLQQLGQNVNRLACIIFASFLSPVDRDELQRLGADVFLTKPFRREELVAAVLRAMEKATDRLARREGDPAQGRA